MKNPISLDGLVSWLEQQDPETSYNYLNPMDCLLCRYLRALGLPVRTVSSFRWQDTDGHCHTLPRAMNSVSEPVSNENHIGTYGEALAVARRLLAAERTGA